MRRLQYSFNLYFHTHVISKCQSCDCHSSSGYVYMFAVLNIDLNFEDRNSQQT